MADFQNTPNSVEEHNPVSDSVVSQPTESTEGASKPEPSTEAAPAVESSEPKEAVPQAKDEIAPVEEKKDEPAAAAAEKPVEPISEGQLSVKAPGFIKSIIPAKREFWLSDEAVPAKHLSSYMRGEKAEIAHEVVAWASQTGKGLLFFNKKGESKSQPSHVLALYNATDLKKQAPHEIHFRLNGENHVLKATSDSERDGWYMALEKAVETGKAIKDETRESEGYKAEKEKLDKPHSAVVGAVAPTPKKSTEVEKTDTPARKNSETEVHDAKDKKSRSASRGVLDRLKSKKDEKKEEKAEKKAETVESKPEEHHKTEEEAAAGVATVGAVAVAQGSSAEDKKDETVESPTEAKTETKPTKRNSIFGKMAGWSSLKSPQKEKTEKDAELKPEVPSKDEPVSDEPPQIPATNVESAEPAVEETKAEEVKPSTPEEKKEATTPGKEKKNNFLSGFLKRDRSVSPSTQMKEAPVKTDETAAAAAEVPTEPTPVEPGKEDEAIAETTAVEPLKPAEEPSKTEKRQSVLGSLGRRASKAFKGINTPKKENTAPATEAKKEETSVAAPATEEPITNGEVKKEESAQPTGVIGDVVPEAVSVGNPEHQPAAVAASA